MASYNSLLCPVKALQQYMYIHERRVHYLHSKVVDFLTMRYISNALQEFLPHNTPGLSSLSFRIEAATTAASAGYPRRLIQSLGRWSSDCFKEYIHIPNNTIASVSASMVKHSADMLYNPDLL